MKEGAQRLRKRVEAQQQRLEMAQAEEDERVEHDRRKQGFIDAEVKAASDELSNTEAGLEKWKKAMEFVHRHEWVPEDAGQEASTLLVESLLESLGENDQTIAGKVRGVQHPSTLSLSSVLGAEVVKINTKVQTLQRKRDKLILKQQQREKKVEQMDQQRKRKALTLLDEDELQKKTDHVNRRRRQLWTHRKSTVKPKRVRRMPKEDFNDLPECKEVKKVYTIEQKARAVAFIREKLQEMRERGQRIGKRARTNLAIMTKREFGISKGVRLWRWVKEEELQKWSSIPSNERKDMKQLPDKWKKANGTGSLRQNGERYGFVPTVVQELLDHHLGHVVMGTSHITPRNEEVLIDQLVHTVSSMCCEYNQGLKKAGRRANCFLLYIYTYIYRVIHLLHTHTFIPLDSFFI